MNHTLNDLQSKFNDKYLYKTISNTRSNIQSENLPLNIKQSSSNFAVNVDKLVQNDVVKLSILSEGNNQSKSSVIPTRKRRYRNSQELSIIDSSTLCSSTNVHGQIRKKSELSCVVCCAVAHGYNFDAISCESCKAFFRRNALSNMDRLKCRRDEDCEITLETRRRCKSCRLKKCFAVGMRKEWILTEEEKESKKRRIEENRRLRFPTNDETTSTKNDFNFPNLFSNKNERSSMKSQQTTQKDDIVANAVLAYNDSFKSDITSYGWSYPVVRKITALCQIINARSTTALRLINFYKRLRDFDILTETDQVNLVKNNLHCILVFHASLVYDPVGDVYHEENTNRKPIHGTDIREVYGTDNYTRVTKIVRALNSIGQLDKRFIQVALVIFLFSTSLLTINNSSESLTTNHQQIFYIQNTYTEQLWLLVERIYGYVRAVHVFSTLISKCLHIQVLLRDIQHDVNGECDSFQESAILQSIMQSV
ncbi:hypothetical protein I4U23_000656 [Adineta vaga]|nr:hypothetical protein I4U23_000656 [Adineta vaga]